MHFICFLLAIGSEYAKNVKINFFIEFLENIIKAGFSKDNQLLFLIEMIYFKWLKITSK